jgi:hypothetical protein
MLSFKKVCSLGLASALVATGLMATTAQAADGDGTGETTTAAAKLDGKSTASFTVDADGELSITKTPTFDFGTVKGSVLTGGQTLKLQGDDTSNQLEVTDTTGHGDHYWTLGANLSEPFTNGSDALTGATMNLAFMNGVNSLKTDSVITTGADNTNGTALPAGTDAAIVTKDNAYPGVSDYTYTSNSGTGSSSGATVVVPAGQSFVNGKYSGEVTWNLSVAP